LLFCLWLLDGSHLTKPAFKNNDTDSVVYTRLLAFTHKVSESILTGMKISIVSYEFQEQLQKKMNKSSIETFWKKTCTNLLSRSTEVNLWVEADLQTAQLVDAEVDTILCHLVKLWHGVGHNLLSTAQRRDSVGI
jgi:hypothetical protein